MLNGSQTGRRCDQHIYSDAYFIYLETDQKGVVYFD